MLYTYIFDTEIKVILRIYPEENMQIVTLYFLIIRMIKKL